MILNELVSEVQPHVDAYKDASLAAATEYEDMKAATTLIGLGLEAEELRQSALASGALQEADRLQQELINKIQEKDDDGDKEMHFAAAALAWAIAHKPVTNFIDSAKVVGEQFTYIDNVWLSSDPHLFSVVTVFDGKDALAGLYSSSNDVGLRVDTAGLIKGSTTDKPAIRLGRNVTLHLSDLQGNVRTSHGVDGRHLNISHFESASIAHDIGGIFSIPIDSYTFLTAGPEAIALQAKLFTQPNLQKVLVAAGVELT